MQLFYERYEGEKENFYTEPTELEFVDWIPNFKIKLIGALLVSSLWRKLISSIKNAVSTHTLYSTYYEWLAIMDNWMDNQIWWMLLDTLTPWFL